MERQWECNKRSSSIYGEAKAIARLMKFHYFWCSHESRAENTLAFTFVRKSQIIARRCTWGAARVITCPSASHWFYQQKWWCAERMRARGVFALGRRWLTAPINNKHRPPEFIFVWKIGFQLMTSLETSFLKNCSWDANDWVEKINNHLTPRSIFSIKTLLELVFNKIKSILNKSKKWIFAALNLCNVQISSKENKYNFTV